MTTANALMVIDSNTALSQAQTRKEIVIRLRQADILRAGVDYGTVPGTVKPTLLKPGAERLCAAFGFDPRFETLTAIEKWDGDEPLFFYRILCRLIHVESGLEVATGIGSCNSREARYRWRWVNEADIPPGVDKATLVTRNSTVREFEFAIKKGETSGKYGKPMAYWQMFRDAIENGTAKKVDAETASGKKMVAYEIGGLQYRIPNDDIFSIVNTIDKIACKRALIAATLIGANASEFFTQDVEDLPEFGGMVGDSADIIEGVVVEDKPQKQTPPAKQEAPATPPPAETNGVYSITNDTAKFTLDTANIFAEYWRERGWQDAEILSALKVNRLGEWQGTVAAATATLLQGKVLS